MSAQDKLPAQTYVSSPHNFISSFVKQGGYSLPPIQKAPIQPVAIPIPLLEERNAHGPVWKGKPRGRKFLSKK
jgi:hypothetical protein